MTTKMTTLQYIRSYDYKYDTLYLKIKRYKVDYTVDIQNILFDISDDEVVGIEFLKASDFLDVDKDFLNSLKYFEIHLDTYEWQEILLEAKLWNDKELMKETKKAIKTDLSEREGLPSSCFTFGNYKGLKRGVSKSDFLTERSIEASIGKDVIRGDFAGFAGFISEREIENETYMQIKRGMEMQVERHMEEIEYDEAGKKSKERRWREVGERIVSYKEV
jgi:uncharacterized protein YuzE